MWEDKIPWIIALAALLSSVIDRILQSGRFLGRKESDLAGTAAIVADLKADLAPKLAAINGLGEWRLGVDRELVRLEKRIDEDHEKHKTTAEKIRIELTQYIDRVEQRLVDRQKEAEAACHARIGRLERAVEAKGAMG